MASSPHERSEIGMQTVQHQRPVSPSPVVHCSSKKTEEEEAAAAVDESSPSSSSVREREVAEEEEEDGAHPTEEEETCFTSFARREPKASAALTGCA